MLKRLNDCKPLERFHEGLPTPPLAMFSFKELMLEYLAVLDDLKGYLEYDLENPIDEEIADCLQVQIDSIDIRTFEVRQLLGIEDYDEEAN